MKRVLLIILVAGFASIAHAEQNAVGRGIQDGAAVPGKATQSVGKGFETAGDRLQPNTGSKTGDMVAGAPGKVVELGGTGIRKTGEMLEGATDFITGAPKDGEAKANLAKPINCNTAKNDIAALQAEKRSTMGKVGEGMKSVMPVTAAIRLLGGTYKDGVKVASGQYNKDLTAKIAKIESTCNMAG